jgi:hypothetical protein
MFFLFIYLFYFIILFFFFTGPICRNPCSTLGNSSDSPTVLTRIDIETMKNRENFPVRDGLFVRFFWGLFGIIDFLIPKK